MTDTGTISGQRPPPLPCDATPEQLNERFLLLARDLQTLGKPVVAGILLGARYIMTIEDLDQDPLGDGRLEPS